VRLAAKLLGWKVDIKSEEEKRQEVESQMEALVVSGAPVSVLIDNGITDHILEKLIEAGIATVEQLGSMTPEQLEEIPGIGPKTVETIQLAVNGYYAQYEDQSGAAGEAVEPAEGVSELLPGDETAEAGFEPGEEAVEATAADGFEPDEAAGEVEAGAVEPVEEALDAAADAGPEPRPPAGAEPQ
jgi:N utilization substance protein A